MFQYTLKRLGQTFLVLIGITLITFLLLNVVPGDPVAMMLDKRADEATIEKVRHEMGLDVPLHEQYIDFVKGAVKLVHWKRNPTTCRLCLGGTFLSVKRLNYKQR